MKSAAELQAELKRYRQYSKKKIARLEASIKKAIEYEEHNPDTFISKQEEIMRATLASYVPHTWAVGEEGYTVWDFGGLACPHLKIFAVFDKPEGKCLNCGPFGPGVPTFRENDFFTDALSAIADYYFRYKDNKETRMPPLMEITREELLRLVREWYFEVKEKLDKNGEA